MRILIEYEKEITLFVDRTDRIEGSFTTNKRNSFKKVDRLDRCNPIRYIKKLSDHDQTI